MEIVVGVTADAHSRDAITLAAGLARTLKMGLAVVHTYPGSYNYVNPGHVDAEWQAFLLQQGNETLDWARTLLADRDDVAYLLHSNRNSGLGLIEVAEERDAAIIVIGSTPGASEGRIQGGFTADQLFHGSPLPVAIAPQGYGTWGPSAIDRAVVAYQRTSESDHSLDISIDVMQRLELTEVIQLALVTVVERTTRIYGSRLGSSAEAQVLEALREQAVQAQEQAIVRAAKLGISLDTAVVEGDSVTSALPKYDWRDEDILVVGSTARGPIKRVLLGDMTYKLMRAATVPVLVIPRSARLPSDESGI